MCRRLDEVRTRAAKKATGRVRRRPAGGSNLLYPLRDALRARATVGEVCDALREVWGVYVPGRVLTERGRRTEVGEDGRAQMAMEWETFVRLGGRTGATPRPS